MAFSGPAPRPDAGLLVLRLGVGALLLFHGVYKITHGVAWIAGPLSGAGLPTWLQYGAYVGEARPVYQIIGMVKDSKYRELQENIEPLIYVAAAQDD